MPDLKFEFNLEENLIDLRDELISGTYKPFPSNCFIIHDPKMREVFAAHFRDRIVYHLFYNYTYKVFDQYVKRKLKCRHYGRYVDDAYIVSADREYLNNLIPEISSFLKEELGLKVHPYKTRIFDASHGVEFLGAYIKPFRTYISSSTLKRIKKKLIGINVQDKKYLQSSINSFLGVFSHYESYCLRRVLFGNNERLKKEGNFDGSCLRFML